jgi:ABC-type spermidine/putrescine transport system permease subunit I
MALGATASVGLIGAGTPDSALALAADIRRERRGLIALTGPALAVMVFLMIAPMFWILAQSFIGSDGGITLDNYAQLFADGAYLASFILTVRIAVIVTALCVVLGYVVSYAMTLMPSWAADVCLALVALPFWTSTLVRTYSWLVLLQNKGVINNLLIDLGAITERLKLVHNETGTLIGMVHIMLPFMIMPLYANLRRIDADYVKAARGLGASAFYAFRRVYLPQSIPGVTAGAVLVFVVSLGFYITPAILGGGRTIMMALAIERDVNLNFNWGPASAAAVVFIGAVLLILVLLSRFISLEKSAG